MKNFAARTLAWVLLSATVACTSSGPRGTEVTRFHLDQPIPAQAMNMEPANPADASSLEYRNYAGFVATELANIGFSVAEGQEAEIFAIVNVTRGMRQQPKKSSPVFVGIGGGSSSGNVGLGGSVGFPVGGSGGRDVYVTELEVRFIGRAENAVMWEGRAKRTSESGPENPSAVVQRLAAALFQEFPGESGKTVVIADPSDQP